MRISLTPQQLKMFLLVAELKNFRRAARALHLSQPALSRTIKQMESALGTTLLDRNTRRVELTAAGVELMPIARRIVSEFDDAFGELAQFMEGRSGRISVAMLPSLGVALLPQAMGSFKACYPSVEFSISGLAARPLLEAIEEGAVDFGITVQPATGKRFDYQHLLRDEFVLVCRNDHPLASAKALPWSTFLEHPFIATSHSSSIRPMTDAAFQRLGLTVRPALEYGGELSICGALIAQGLGITAVPRLALHLMNCARLTAVRLHRPILHRRIGIVTRSGRTLSTAALNFKTHVAACLTSGSG